MLKKFSLLFAAALTLSVPLHAQNAGTGPVTKYTSGANRNDILEDLNVGAGRTLNNKGTLNGTGTFDFRTAASLLFADNQIPWAKVNKIGIAASDLGTGTPTSSTYLRGDRSWATLDKAAVGLSAVENIALSTWTGSTNLAVLSPTLTNINSVTASSATALTLAGGSSGATVQIGKGTDGRIVLTPSTAVSTGYEYVDIQSTTAGGTMGGDSFGLRTLFTINHTTVAYHSAAVLMQANIPASNATNITQWVGGGYGYISHRGSGLLSEGRTFNAYLDVYGSGDVAEAVNFYSKFTNNTGTGRIRKAFQFKATVLANTSAVTLPDQFYGFYCEDISAQANPSGGVVYAFYSAGNTPSLFGPTTVGSLTTGGVISTTGTSAATGFSDGVLRVEGGGHIAKNLYLGTQLVFAATGTTNAIGINFGSGEYIYRAGAGTVAIDGANVEVQGDLKPKTTGAYDLGSTSQKWRQLFISGAATVGSLTTANPTSGTAAAWKLGSRAAATVALDTTQYLQVDVAGTAYKVAIVN